MLLMMLAGWINKEQQHVIEYLREETVRTRVFLVFDRLLDVSIIRKMSFDTLLKQRFDLAITTLKTR